MVFPLLIGALGDLAYVSIPALVGLGVGAVSKGLAEMKKSYFPSKVDILEAQKNLVKEQKDLSVELKDAPETTKKILDDNTGENKGFSLSFVDKILLSGVFLILIKEVFKNG